MAYTHNMIGGPSNIEGAEDVEINVIRDDNSEETINVWDTPDMMNHRGSWVSDGVTFIPDGHNEGNSLN